jgi:hypothetical protein
MTAFRSMNTALIAGVLIASRALAMESAIPAAWPASRYEKMVEKSPFALATPVAPPSAPQASFAAHWYVTGVGRLGDQDFVTIKSHDASTQFSLLGRETNQENGGVSLASVDWSDKLGKTSVIIKKGTETAKLEFDQSLLNAPVPPPGAGNPVARPGPGPMPVTNTAPVTPGAMQPRIALPRPSSAPVVAPAPTTAPPSSFTQPAGSGENRRRIRSIAAPQ